jgi:hypothetical protein
VSPHLIQQSSNGRRWLWLNCKFSVIFIFCPHRWLTMLFSSDRSCHPNQTLVDIWAACARPGTWEWEVERRTGDCESEEAGDGRSSDWDWKWRHCVLGMCYFFRRSFYRFTASSKTERKCIWLIVYNIIVSVLISWYDTLVNLIPSQTWRLIKTSSDRFCIRCNFLTAASMLAKYFRLTPYFSVCIALLVLRGRALISSLVRMDSYWNMCLAFPKRCL